MIRKLWHSGGKIGLYCLILIQFIACGNVELVPAFFYSYKNVATTVDFCTSDSNAVKTNIKFIFVVDRSGSNQGVGGTPTDLFGNRRFDAITQFTRSFPINADNKGYVWFSQYNFNDANILANEQPFTTDRPAFLSYVANEKSTTTTTDNGATDYVDVLDRILTIVQADIAAAKIADPVISSSYIIFFLSDGVPEDQNGNPILKSTVVKSVQAIKALEDVPGNSDVLDSILLSTIYYYNKLDLAADDMMKTMANEGDGEHIRSDAGDVIDFNRFTLPDLNLRFTLQEIWVQNASNIWDNEYIRRDTDMDGFHDDAETLNGSDPARYDTDGDGVGDGVLFRLTGAPCSNVDFATIGCIREGSADWPKPPPIQCASLGAPPYDDTDGDFLNDCEEKILKSNWRDGDSNKDFIPDSLAFYNEIKVADESYATSLDPDFDDLSDYKELKFNLPTRFSNANLQGSRPMRYVGKLLSSDDQEDCHKYDIHDIVSTSGNDSIRVFLFESSLVSERRLIRAAEKSMVNGAATFINSDFKYLGSPR